MRSNYHSDIMKEICPLGQVSFFNVEQVIAKVLMSMHDDVPHPTKVQIRITNLDKKQVRLYQRISNDVP